MGAAGNAWESHYGVLVGIVFSQLHGPQDIIDGQADFDDRYVGHLANHFRRTAPGYDDVIVSLDIFLGNINPLF